MTTDAIAEPREIAIKRLKIRSMRRGIKEMDILLTAWADMRLAELDDETLALYDTLLEENDQDLYVWVCGREAPPPRFAALLQEIAQTIQNKAENT
ncbi:succinate dehydrogenase assembly factor 2 [Chachezhania antarctica]|uniref:succinate dehydrogenase assembly factor 2 n=1 Tax=Chachezhania antarctica TaxID=2340860 RepID=UPI000EB45C86|nr:succinate dehydrogenase assembly factor 2 [Chachezhania antarctica]|tara:strand:- start:14446 stop:14733 length:288 start_codon:yes stop_codon:yes gene_type:complete